MPNNLIVAADGAVAFSLVLDMELECGRQCGFGAAVAQHLTTHVVQTEHAEP